MNITLKTLNNRTAQILLTIFLYTLFAEYMPKILHEIFYTNSVFMKDILLFLMPLTITFFIAYSIKSFENKAFIFVISILLFEAVSNTFSVLYAFFWADYVAYNIPYFIIHEFKHTLTPLWKLSLSKPRFWCPEGGLLLGTTLGVIASFTKNRFLNTFINTGKSYVEFIITKIFARFIPLFVLGFIAQLKTSGVLGDIISEYSIFLLWLGLAIVLYIVMIFAIGASFNLRNTLHNIKNVLPASITAFTTGCSMSTMPLTISCTGKNLKDPNLAKAVIPSTTNIQQSGDCIINAFLCYVIHMQFYGIAPDFKTIITFTIAFVIARYTTAAVLGGAIFIMIPIYESYLNFTPEMVAIILGFNIILDPIVTSSNVTANSGLCRVFEIIWNKIIKKERIGKKAQDINNIDKVLEAPQGHH